MSEFCCRLGCIMSSEERRRGYCEEHKLPIYTMDGMTAKQIQQMERNEAGIEEEE